MSSKSTRPILEHVLVVAIRPAQRRGAYFGIALHLLLRSARIRRTVAVAVVALGLASVAAGCGSSDADGPTPATGHQTTVVDGPAPAVYSDPNVVITVNLGQEFEIALPADPRAGLSWQAVAPPNPIVLLSMGSSFRPAATPGKLEQILHYGARGPGLTAVPLRYASPKAGAKVLDTKTFTVSVVDPNAPPPPPPPPTSSTTVAPGPGRTTTTIKH